MIFIQSGVQNKIYTLMFIGIFNGETMNKKALYSIVVVIIVVVARLGIYFSVHHPAKASKPTVVFAATVSSGQEYIFDRNMGLDHNETDPRVTVTLSRESRTKTDIFDNEINSELRFSVDSERFYVFGPDGLRIKSPILKVHSPEKLLKTGKGK